jgi:hypothetical protein
VGFGACAASGQISRYHLMDERLGKIPAKCGFRDFDVLTARYRELHGHLPIPPY